MFSWLNKLIEKIFPPDYGIYKKGSFPTERKLNLKQAKSLILAGGKKERWQKETEINFEFLKKNFLEKRKNEPLLVLDYGIGIGRLTLPILENYPKIKVIGIDESESMLELTKQYLPQKYFLNEQIKLYKPTELNNLKKESFDLILAVYVFQHIFLEELEKILFNLYQLLKKDGALFFVGTLQNDDNQKRKIQIKPLLERYFILKEEISPYKNKEEYIKWMKVAGYGDWGKMEKARLRCQKMMALYKKIITPNV